MQWRVRVWRSKPVHLHFPLRSFRITGRKNTLLTILDAKNSSHLDVREGNNHMWHLIYATTEKSFAFSTWTGPRMLTPQH